MYDYDEERRRRIEEQEQRREDERVARYWADREERDRDFYRQEERERKARERDQLESDRERRKYLSNYPYGSDNSSSVRSNYDDVDTSCWGIFKVIAGSFGSIFGILYLLYLWANHY